MGSSTFFTLVVFVGGFLVLGAVILWAMRNNRQSPREYERTEDATRKLYDGDPVDHSKR